MIELACIKQKPDQLVKIMFCSPGLIHMAQLESPAHIYGYNDQIMILDSLQNNENIRLREERSSWTMLCGTSVAVVCHHF